MEDHGRQVNWLKGQGEQVSSFAGRDARKVAGFQYDEIIKAIDWNRVLIQAYGRHEKIHPKRGETSGLSVCGDCIKSVLLRTEEPEDLASILARIATQDLPKGLSIYSGNERNLMELEWHDVEEEPPNDQGFLWAYLENNKIDVIKFKDGVWVYAFKPETVITKVQAWAHFVYPPVPKRVWES